MGEFKSGRFEATKMNPAQVRDTWTAHDGDVQADSPWSEGLSDALRTQQLSCERQKKGQLTEVGIKLTQRLLLLSQLLVKKSCLRTSDYYENPGQRTGSVPLSPFGGVFSLQSEPSIAIQRVVYFRVKLFDKLQDPTNQSRRIFMLPLTFNTNTVLLIDASMIQPLLLNLRKP